MTPVELLRILSKRLDGSWNIVFLNARGQMFVSRDPLGMRPLCYAVEGSMFAAASESVALTHLGFSEDSVKNVPPGHVVVVDGQTVRVERVCGKPEESSLLL
ncbi:MAG: hypothetical protein U0936_26015 [Planctomycetaceae bacterium]